MSEMRTGVNAVGAKVEERKVFGVSYWFVIDDETRRPVQLINDDTGRRVAGTELAPFLSKASAEAYVGSTSGLVPA